ncbi:TetR/AcrR family transcriptional regulator C-terminal domain-containing protein [Kibdelosporangium lantanae]
MGVAVATANRAMTTLRDGGLVEATVGSGTVVSNHGRTVSPAVSRKPRQASTSRHPLSRMHVVRAAIAIADVEGLDAVSMRRLAVDLGVGPMSLYRHVANKDELVTRMADEVFGECDLPVPGPDGWRAKLELIARQQWELCGRHLWLPGVVSFTRPALVPNMMAHTEWTLRALDGLGLPMTTRVREALTLHGLVITAASAMAAEVESQQETGVTLDGWWHAQRQRADRLLDSGRFPLLATIPAGTTSDLGGLFEYGLARHLDGFATLLEGHPPDTWQSGSDGPGPARTVRP